ncbi:MAG TPA: hypothetical protein VFM68_03955 [Candidatus Saccharimonadales bacterium]|nr:hypothetical protein [Candidatus Saccharimonadales bacterium]
MSRGKKKPQAEHRDKYDNHARATRPERDALLKKVDARIARQAKEKEEGKRGRSGWEYDDLYGPTDPTDCPAPQNAEQQLLHDIFTGGEK